MVSSIPNHRIKSGENAVTGMYRIADITGWIISFNGLTAVRSTAIGIAAIMENSAAIEILANEYSSPGSSCPVSASPIHAVRTDIGDGINNGVVNMEPICQTAMNIAIPASFFGNPRRLIFCMIVPFL